MPLLARVSGLAARRPRSSSHTHPLSPDLFRGLVSVATSRGGAWTGEGGRPRNKSGGSGAFVCGRHFFSPTGERAARGASPPPCPGCNRDRAAGLALFAQAVDHAGDAPGRSRGGGGLFLGLGFLVFLVGSFLAFGHGVLLRTRRIRRTRTAWIIRPIAGSGYGVLPARGLACSPRLGAHGALP